MKNLKTYSTDYYDFISMLSLENTYYILISKRLLLKPMVPIWMFLFGLFLVRSNIFFTIVGIPSIFIFSVFLAMLFPLWKACNISAKAYIIFHSIFVLLLKISSIPVSILLEVLWTLCF